MTSRTLLAEIFVRVLYPLLLGVSLWVMLRGHNAPGGGFIGGLLAVAASAAYALVYGSGKALGRLPLAPLRLAGCGVLLAILSGLPAAFLGLPFLTQLWWQLPLGGGAKLPFSTVMLFDFGVYLCVWGGVGGYCLSLVGMIEEQS
jgi:multicomponent Na+:H+ antiporter subunit B